MFGTPQFPIPNSKGVKIEGDNAQTPIPNSQFPRGKNRRGACGYTFFCVCMVTLVTERLHLIMSEGKSFVVDGVWSGSDGATYTYGKAPLRKCVTCRGDYEWDGNIYKTRCKPCYIRLVRVCASCKMNNLKADAPHYQKVCTDCWLAKRAKHFGTCPRCPPERAQHLRRPLSKACCSECEVRCEQPVPLGSIVPLARDEILE